MNHTLRLRCGSVGAMKSLAEMLIESLEGKPLESAYDFLNRANAYAELGRHEDAIADYERANEVQPDYERGMAWFNRANSLCALERWDDALTSYERAIGAGTTEWAPFLNAALLRLREKRFDEALGYYDRYLALGVPDDEWGCANAEARARKAEIVRWLGRE